MVSDYAAQCLLLHQRLEENKGMEHTTSAGPDSRRVDFLQGLDAYAPGVTRAQEPLVEALSRDRRYNMHLIRFSTVSPRFWFPMLYGSLPARLAMQRSSLTHIGNSWYAHLVPLLSSPTIVTCHDVIELDELLSNRRHLRPHRKFHVQAAFRGMLQARLIVCVSQATARRVICYAPAVEARVRVVYSGLSPIFSSGPPDAAALRKLAVEQPYVLYVGSEQTRKNLARLVAAIAQAKRSVSDLHFVKVGASQTTEGHTEFLEVLHREGMTASTTMLEHVSDENLLALYRGAAVTMLVSLDEGFGFPPLEAMASGCPAVVSDRGALPEISGGHAIVVDPLDIRAMASAIVRVVNDPLLRQDLSARAGRWAGTFTWERAARQYGTLYDHVMDHS